MSAIEKYPEVLCGKRAWTSRMVSIWANNAGEVPGAKWLRVPFQSADMPFLRALLRSGLCRVARPLNGIVYGRDAVAMPARGKGVLFLVSVALLVPR